MTKFSDLGLNPLLMRAITEEGYETPTPIQAQAIPLLLEDKDLLGIAQTGTGKTAAFALPTLDFMLEFPQKRRARSARVLVLAPTRELAGQIAESFRTYSRHMDCNVQTVFGGVNINAQRRALQGGADILVATPGRLLDLVGAEGSQPSGNRSPDPRRSRPDARYGLYPRPEEDRGAGAERPPDTPVLGHHAEADLRSCPAISG
jgi:superfamily II DNA/RNA helicase